MECPLCRKIFSIPQHGVKDLPNNFFMNQLLQVNESQIARASSKDEITVCDLCSDMDVKTTATACCIECDQNFCGRHSVTHKKNKMSSSHQVIDLQNIPSAEERIKMVVRFCEKHPNKQIELYCYDCKIVTCLMCYVKEHNKHVCTDLKESGEKFSIQLKDDIEKVMKCALQNKEDIEFIELEKKHFIEKCLAAQNRLFEKCDQVIALIQSHRIQLMEELDSFKKEQLKEIESRKDEAERQFVIVESFKRYCEEVKDKGTACDISQAANDLHFRAEELVKIPVQPNSSELLRFVVMFTPSLVTTNTTVKNLIGKLSFKGQFSFMKL